MWSRIKHAGHALARHFDALPAWLALLLGVGLALAASTSLDATVLVPLLLAIAAALAFTAEPQAVTVAPKTETPAAREHVERDQA